MAARIRFRRFYECDTESDRSLDFGQDSLLYCLDTQKYYRIYNSAYEEVLPDEVIFISPIPISKLSISGVPDGTKFLRDDGSWATPVGGGGGGGHIIYDSAGTPLTQQPGLKFSRLSVTNDALNSLTLVTRPSDTFIGITAPANPLEGDEWTNSETWKTYKYYDGFWVELTGGSGGGGAGIGTVSSVSVTSANGFAGTVLNPTTTPAITISTTITGILKGNGTSISAAIPGTDYQAVLTNPVTGTGTSGQVAYWNGTTTQTGSNNLFWDAIGNRLGLGTTTPSYSLDVQGSTLASSSIRVQGAFDINTLAQPSAIGGFTLSAGSNLGVGQYYYFVTYVTSIGETNASNTLSVVTTSGNTTVNLTGIPISSDSRVIARKLYRTKLNGTSDNQFFLTTINDNSTTVYTDSATDASLPGTSLQYYKINTTSRYITVAGIQGMVIDNNLTAFGRNAGNAAITSSAPAVRAVYIGASAGQNVTTGSGNIIVGVAGVSLTTGSFNTLVGDLAGYVVLSSYNTLIGAFSGRFLSGSGTGYNTILGAGSGMYLADGTTQFTTGINNVLLGSNIRMSTATDENSIVVGHDARGLGSNTTVIGNSSTTFGRWWGNLLVGTSTNSGFALDVNGTARIQGATTITGNLTVDTNTLFVDATNDRVGIGTQTPSVLLHTSGFDASNTNVFRLTNTANIGTTQWANVISHDIQFHYTDPSMGPSIYASIRAVGNSNSGAISAGTIDTDLSFLTGGYSTTVLTERLRIFSNGNIGIGVAGVDAGFKLDVNGTARIQNDLTISDTRNIILATTTGTKIGTATSQKLGFFNATPVVQPSAVTTAQGIANALSSLGLIAPSTIAGIASFMQTDYDSAIVGVRNGVNTLFTLSTNFVSGTTKVFVNGLRYSLGASNDYVETGTNQITFTNPPDSGDILVVDYLKP